MHFSPLFSYIKSNLSERNSVLNCNSSNYDRYRMNDRCRFDPERMPIAMAYVPWQRFERVYELDKALQIGTIFADLNKTFRGQVGKCNECRM